MKRKKQETPPRTVVTVVPVSRKTRIRCPHCAQWPTLTRRGCYTQHRYPWWNTPTGYAGPCPGSGTTPDQPSLPLEQQEPPTP